jgi:hypothetical protein
MRPISFFTRPRPSSSPVTFAASKMSSSFWRCAVQTTSRTSAALTSGAPVRIDCPRGPSSGHMAPAETIAVRRGCVQFAAHGRRLQDSTAPRGVGSSRQPSPARSRRRLPPSGFSPPSFQRPVRCSRHRSVRITAQRRNAEALGIAQNGPYHLAQQCLIANSTIAAELLGAAG